MLFGVYVPAEEIVLTIQSDNGKQGYKVGGKKYRRPKVVLPGGPCERYSSDWIRRRDQSRARSVTSTFVETYVEGVSIHTLGFIDT